MRTIRTIPELRAFVSPRRAEGVALVPTMGALHDGHLALMRDAKRRAKTVVASIFVNPTQFGPGEDLERYPRDLDGDGQKCHAAGVDAVFAPDVATLYPLNHTTRVSVSGVTEGLCGASRPVHFTGVATIVTKLFNIVAPDLAIFGEKDYQQLTAIRRLARDLDFPITIVGHPTVREPDGLAMSSRNRHLAPDERRAAPGIYRALEATRAIFRAGERRRGLLEQTLMENLRHVEFSKVEYAEVRDEETLEIADEPRAPVALVAVVMGNGPHTTRLIDNLRLAATP